MLESVVSNQLNNIGSSFTNNCDVKLNLRTWLETENLQSICSNSNRLYRKRFYPSTFEKEYLHHQTNEGIWKRRKEYINKPSEFSTKRNKKSRKSKNDCYRKPRLSDRMTRTSCCQIRRHQDTRYVNNRTEYSDSSYHRNRSLSQSNVGMCLPHNQLPVIDDSSDHLRNVTTNRRHINSNLLHQMSTHSTHQTIIQDKETLTTSNNFNNYCNIQSSQINPSSQCGLLNQFQMMSGNSTIFRQANQANICSQTSRTRHHNSDVSLSFQPGVSTSTQYLPPRQVNNTTSQSPLSACSIPNRTISNNTSSFPIVTRSFCQHPNQLRFATYPINPYSGQQQQQTMFSRTSAVPAATTILPHNSAFCSTVQMPTVIGDVISSTPCHQCAIIAAGSTALNTTFSNLSSMFQFSVAPTAASLITLAAVSSDRIHGSRLNYVPVHAINNWHNQHYLPAAWSYNDLSSILHNSTARHILQDHLAQRILSTSPNVGIQFVMMTPSSVLGGPNDASHIRHHLIPVSRTDSLSTIAVSRYLPIIDHLPLIDQPRPGITNQELDQIPIRKFIKIEIDNFETEDDKDRCMICLEDFMPNEIIRMLKCSHDFHSSCVERWLKVSCFKHMSPEPEQEIALPQY